MEPQESFEPENPNVARLFNYLSTQNQDELPKLLDEFIAIENINHYFSLDLQSWNNIKVLIKNGSRGDTLTLRDYAMSLNFQKLPEMEVFRYYIGKIDPKHLSMSFEKAIKIAIIEETLQRLKSE
jgi:hypothetical protein